jgi:hypothetical protein
MTGWKANDGVEGSSEVCVWVLRRDQAGMGLPRPIQLSLAKTRLPNTPSRSVPSLISKPSVHLLGTYQITFLTGMSGQVGASYLISSSLRKGM